MGAFNIKICVLAACLLIAAQASGYTMDDLCKQWSGTGYIGNPSNCRGWGYCKNQEVVAWDTCPNGEVFNAQTGSCANASTTICTTSSEKTCSSVVSPMYVADTQNCSQYCYCDGKGGLAYGNCGTGGVFSQSSGKCVWGPACPQDTICQFMLSNIFVGDPNNCGSYLKCVNGYGTSTKCESPLYYNAATGNCQKTNPCDGTSDNSNTNTGDFTIGQAAEGVCSSTTKKAPVKRAAAAADADAEYVSDKTTCYGYYYCASDTATTGYWNKCPTGTHFDPTLSKCVSPASYACPYNRCGNVDTTFMAVVNTDCASYTICSSGTEGDCPTGTAYDEVHDLCTTTKLTYPVCTETVTLTT
ncbi:peritrophin-44 [Drosophila eugracilis]|uniref:peritrophin-44 n=1 Tax=Drosophila eugracilis TaxID=29029 RepID=UPI0007E86300|nr:peritrophin-44 [Drosophila eugracilis]